MAKPLDQSMHSTTAIIRRCVRASPDADLIEELIDRGYAVAKPEKTDANNQDKGS